MFCSPSELKLVGGNVRLRFDYGSGSKVVSTHGRNYSDNTWHKVSGCHTWAMYARGLKGQQSPEKRLSTQDTGQYK